MGYIGGFSTLSCGSDQSLFGTSPSCTAQVCPALSSAQPGMTSDCEAVALGGSCTADCGIEGYRRKSGPPRDFTCSLVNNTPKLVGLAVICEAVPCEFDFPPSNFPYSHDCNGKGLGEKCTVKCDSSMDGGNTSYTCLKSKSFSGTPPVCKPKAGATTQNVKKITGTFSLSMDKATSDKWQKDPTVKESLKRAIAKTLAGVDASMVNITAVEAVKATGSGGRRLQPQTSGLLQRRLSTTTSLEIGYEIIIPATASPQALAITPLDIVNSASALKTNIEAETGQTVSAIKVHEPAAGIVEVIKITTTYTTTTTTTTTAAPTNATNETSPAPRNKVPKASCSTQGLWLVCFTILFALANSN